MAKKKKAASSAAAVLVVGNPATDRKAVDSYSNFTVIDTNHPVAATGFVRASSSTTPRARKASEFVLVDKDNTVEWMSATITPAAAVQTYTAPAPVPVQAG